MYGYIPVCEIHDFNIMMNNYSDMEPFLILNGIYMYIVFGPMMSIRVSLKVNTRFSYVDNILEYCVL